MKKIIILCHVFSQKIKGGDLPYFMQTGVAT